VEKAFSDILKDGPVDVLVNNAGVLLAGPVEQLTEQDVNDVLNTNVLGAIRTIQAVLPSMRARKSGTIVNVSSILGCFTFICAGLYSASKAALESLSQALHQELRPFGIRVVVADPGTTKSNLVINSREGGRVLEGNPYQEQVEKARNFQKALLASAGPTEEVADQIVSVVEKPDDTFRFRPAKDEVLIGAVLVDTHGLNLPPLGI